MMPPAEEPRAELLSRLDAELASVLGPLVPAGARCVLVDLPAHGNVGDGAIWLGERAYLRRIGASVVHACDAASYSRAELRRHVGDGVVLLHGGGNLGDLWPLHQRL